MKKIIIFLITIVIISLTGIKIYHYSIKYYSITYKRNNYQITETFIKNKKDNYYFKISKNNNRYTFTKNLTKKKNQIQEIKSMKRNNLECIIPIFQNNQELSIYCNQNNSQQSISYLIESNNEDFKEIQNKIKKYKISYPTKYETKVKYDNLKVYYDNIEEDDIYIIWNYKGFYKVTKDNTKNVKILDYDLYDNICATILDHYFVLIENTNVIGIKNIYYYNLKKDKLKRIQVKETISKDSYINGVYNNLIYLTDRENKKQYTINIMKEEIKEIDKEQTEYISYHENKEIFTLQEFFQKDQFFSSSDYFEKYYQKDNLLYKYYEKKENSILLLELDNIKDWKIFDNQLLIIQEDELYSYTEKEGLRLILNSNELKYNYKDIYYLGRK